MDKDRFFSARADGAPPPPPASVNWTSPAISWDHSLDHSAHFESALSSLVSSPTSDNNNPAAAAGAAASARSAVDNFAIRELIGRLGTICSSENNFNSSNSASCYATPLNSPPKLNLFSSSVAGMGNLVPVPTDPGFVERAARLSCFNGSGNYGNLLEPGKLSRVSSSRSLRAGVSNEFQASEGIGTRPSTPVEEESSVSDPGSAGEGNARKRKANARGKEKELGSSASIKDNGKMEEDDNANAKRSRSADGGNNAKNAGEVKTEQKKGKDSDAKHLETPKQDYIHVRARRGQATDRHSLAERVRREKISERMKLLQDLVPGCNKIIGKAVMLDEIINYVQSLQRQVEFLSMKLATLNPHVDFSMENLHIKDMNQACGPVSNSMQLLETQNAPFFQYPLQLQQGAPLHPGEAAVAESQCSMNQLGFALPRSLSMQIPSFEGFPESASQYGSFMENDLHSFVQMSYGQNLDISLSSQNFNGELPTGNMKLELS